MPPRYRKKFYRKKRHYRKRRGVPRAPRANRLSGRQPNVYNFTRSSVENITLSSSVAPSGWTSEVVPGTAQINAIYKQYVFSLNMIPDVSEFQNLFTSYRINAVRIVFYPSTGLGGGSSSLGSQIIVMTTPHQQGSTIALTEDYFLQSQISRKRLMLNQSGRPYVQYFKLAQLSHRYASLTNTDYAMVKPRWVSTSEDACAHYGINCRLQTINTTGFASLSFRVETKFYLQMRQVK